MLSGMIQSIGVGGTVEASELNLLTGNVGIGTASPAYKLDVVGTVRTSGYALLDDIFYGNGESIAYKSWGRGRISFLNRTGGEADPINLYSGDGTTYTGGYLSFSTDGSEQMRIDNTGNVGIGTTSPEAMLDIVGDAADNNDRHEGIWMRGRTGASIVQLNVKGDNLEIGGGGALDTSPSMVVDFSSGNVGIGTTSPITRTGFGSPWLSISSTAPGIALIDSDNANTTRYIANSGGGMSIGKMNDDGTSPSDQMFISGSGSVGIGTTSPSAKLHVKGDVIFGEGSELTIASGAITPTHAFHQVDTESDASTDDLDTINGASTGKMLILKAKVTGRTIVLKDTGGNLRLAGGDFSMDNGNDMITLMGVGSIWYEISRSDNA